MSNIDCNKTATEQYQAERECQININDASLLDSIRETCEYLRGNELMDSKGVKEVFKGLGFPVLENV